MKINKKFSVLRSLRMKGLRRFSVCETMHHFNKELCAIMCSFRLCENQ